MAAPTLTPTGQVVYDWLGPAQTDPDADNGYAFAHLVDAATAALAEVEAVTRASAGRPGWAVALDPDTVPLALIPWLAQFAGVRFDARISPGAMRAKIKERPYHRRGTVEAILNAARAWLSFGDVTLVERDGSPWQLTVQYSGAQVGQLTYDQLAAAHPTYPDVAAAFKRYSDMAGDEPRLQAEVLLAKPVGLVVTFDVTA